MRRTTTLTGSCSSSCSPETSSRRRCAGSSERSPRLRPRTPRASRDLGVAEVDRTQSPCSPRAPGSDPGSLEEEEDATTRNHQCLSRDSMEMKLSSISRVTASKVTGRERLLEKTDSTEQHRQPRTWDLSGEPWQLLYPLGTDLALGHRVLGLLIDVSRRGGNWEGF